MAIDPRIALGIQAPDLGQSFLQGQQMAANAQTLRQNRQTQESQRLLGLALGGGDQGSQALDQLMKTDPMAAFKAKEVMRQNKSAISQEFITETALSSQEASTLLQRGDVEGAVGILQGQIAKAKELGLDPSGGLKTLELLKSGDVKAAQQDLQADLVEAERRGYLKPVKTEKPDKPPTSIQEYEFAKQQGFQGSLLDFMTAKREQDQMVVYDAQGNPIVATGGAKPTKLTEQQSKDLVYYQRGKEALDLFEGDVRLSEQGEIVQDGDGKPMGEALTQMMGATLGQIPVVGNYLKSPEYRQAENLAKNFLASVLRKDTGAAVTKPEFELYGAMFLPTPGDDDKTLAYKSKMRQVAIDAIRSGLGTAEAILQARQAAAQSVPQDAPSGAVEYLKSNPDSAPFFKQKYGYLPEGFDG